MLRRCNAAKLRRQWMRKSIAKQRDWKKWLQWRETKASMPQCIGANKERSEAVRVADARRCGIASRVSWKFDYECAALSGSRDANYARFMQRSVTKNKYVWIPTYASCKGPLPYYFPKTYEFLRMEVFLTDGHAALEPIVFLFFLSLACGEGYDGAYGA